MRDLREKARELAKSVLKSTPGREEWWIGNDLAVCMRFGHSDFHDPEKAAYEWFSQRREYCEIREYVVKRVIAHTSAEFSMRRIARELLDALDKDAQGKAATQHRIEGHTEGAPGVRPHALHIHENTGGREWA